MLATSYRADLFEPVLGDGSRWGVRLDYVQEQEPLGTGGAIRNVAGALGDDPEGAVVILNGDVLSGHDLGAQLADFETPRDGRAGRRVAPPGRGRGRPRLRVRARPTAPAGSPASSRSPSDPVTNQVNAGCYVFRRRVVDAIPTGRVVSVERETFPGLVADGALVVGYVENAYWRDVGTPAALVAASRDLVLGVAPSPGRRPGEGGVRVDPAAEVAAPRLDDGSVVLAGAGSARAPGSPAAC